MSVSSPSGERSPAVDDPWSALKTADAALADARVAGGDVDGPGLAMLAAEDALLRGSGGRPSAEHEARAVRWARRLIGECRQTISGGFLGIGASGPDLALVEMLDLAVDRVARWSSGRQASGELAGAVERVRVSRTASVGAWRRVLVDAALIAVTAIVGWRTARLLPGFSSSSDPAIDRRETPLLALEATLAKLARELDG